MKRLLFETDWLASKPVFYNDKTGQASHNINDVIDHANVELDPEGFNNYLDFGYSVLEQTPVKHVKFLRHSSRLWVNEHGMLTVEHLEDPVAHWLHYCLSEDDVIELIRERVRAWERSVKGEIIIPTSGGYDSRLLNWCIEDKSRIRAFTYGISENQSESFEVVYASKLAEILGTCWEQIPLGSFHRYFDQWDKLYGVSTHAHGMYHLEFFNLVRSRVGAGRPLLSGLNGDSWAGSRLQAVLEAQQISVPTAEQLPAMGLTHGMHADAAYSNFKTALALRREFLIQNGSWLAEGTWKFIWKTRFKNVLMSYLLAVPSCLGFTAWSPFHDIDIAMAMLNLPSERKRDRLWQREFFQKQGLDLESMGLRATRENMLNHVAMDRIPLQPLDESLLSEVVAPQYVRWINGAVRPRRASRRWLERTHTKLARYRGGYRPYVRVHAWVQQQQSARLKAYCAYLTLKPIEALLRRRDQAQREPV